MIRKRGEAPKTGKLVAQDIRLPDPALSEFEQQMFIARQIMDEDRDMLAKLAKL